VYVTSPPGTVHLTTDRALALSPGSARTLCGRTVADDWTAGDETLSGVAATCARCRNQMRRRMQDQAR
jgi:hypothetical protein